MNLRLRDANCGGIIESHFGGGREFLVPGRRWWSVAVVVHFGYTPVHHRNQRIDFMSRHLPEL